MNKKKLSHSNLNSSITSVLAALLCIVIGMAVGFLVLLAINPAHAWGDGFVRIIKGGFHDAPYGVGKELANAAPLIMTGLSVAFAFKTGLFNIGAAGQYTLGAYGALYCAIMLKMPWYICLIVATILGGIWGAIPGFFKAYFNINEVITSIMFNWIGLYLVNELVYQNGTGPMYDVRNTRTLNLGKSAELSQSLIPDFGLNKMFQTNSTTIAIFLAAAVAILIWVILNKTTFGYELKAVGLNKSAARYAGINEKEYLEYKRTQLSGIDQPEYNNLELILSDQSTYRYKGKVETVEGDFERGTGSIAFRARFANPERLLRHGVSGKIRMLTKMENVVLVPQQSTFEIQDFTYVYTVAEDGKVSVRSFEPLARHGSYYVTQDLPDQTVIVYEGVQMITDGMTINPDMVDGATIRRQLESSNEIENNK